MNDDEDITGEHPIYPPQAGNQGMQPPSVQISPTPTGGVKFPNPPTGQFSNPPGQFPNPPAGQFPNPPGQFPNPPGQFPNPPTGQFPSSPTGQFPPTPGQFSNPPTGQFPSSPTGQFSPIAPSTADETGEAGIAMGSPTTANIKINAGSNLPREIDPKTRAMYGAAGFFGGGLAGLLLGIMNSAMEQVDLGAGMGVTMQISIWFALLFGLACGAFPDRIENVLREHELID